MNIYESIKAAISVHFLVDFAAAFVVTDREA